MRIGEIEQGRPHSKARSMQLQRRLRRPILRPASNVRGIYMARCKIPRVRVRVVILF